MRLTLANPHTHLREGEVVGPLVKKAIEGGACVLGPMPNTKHGLMTAEDVARYIDTCTCHAISCSPRQRVHFIGIVQITERTTPAMIDACVDAGIMDAKVYPKGRTTESHNGVPHYMRILDAVRHAGERGMRVHFHPEHPSALYDNRDAEFAFLPLVDIFLNETDTTVVWEHGTDGRCIPHWEEWAKSERFFVTLTAHHLLANESSTYGDVQAACKPSYKREDDRRGLVELVGKDHSWVMAGGDDAPHPKGDKHRIGPCACGAYTAPFLLPLYVHALYDSLTQHRSATQEHILYNFLYGNAAGLYDIDKPLTTVSVVRKPFTIPLSYTIGPWEVEPFWAGRTIDFSIEP